MNIKLFLSLCLILLTVTIATAGIDWSIEKSTNRALKIHKVLQGFEFETEVPEIAWIDIDDNDIYIGFTSLPLDYATLLKAIALNCNWEINFGVHVWAVDAKYKHWRPGDSSYYFETTARYGKIED